MSAGKQPLLPSARELFPVLRARLLASRPVIAFRYRLFPGGPWLTVPLSEKGITGISRFGKSAELIYGKPTFRNVIDAEGKHV